MNEYQDPGDLVEFNENLNQYNIISYNAIYDHVRNNGTFSIFYIIPGQGYKTYKYENKPVEFIHIQPQPAVRYRTELFDKNGKKAVFLDSTLGGPERIPGMVLEAVAPPSVFFIVKKPLAGGSRKRKTRGNKTKGNKTRGKNRGRKERR